MAENPPINPQDGDRRSFLRMAAWGGGIAGLGALAGLGATRIPRAKPAAKSLGAEFTYDVSRFQKTDPALIRYEEISRFPAGLERARNIAAAADGSIFVVGTGGIRRFSPDGELMLSIPSEQAVYSLAPLPSGGFLAGKQGQIVVFDPSGAEAEVWVDVPAGMLPTSIAIEGDDIFVADAANRTIVKLDANGKKTGSIAGFKVPSPYFCVRMAPDGLLRVTNPGELRIEAYTRDGEFELAWGKPSFAVDGFCGCCNPVSFDIFPDGSYVTCEKGLPRVKLYDSHGGFTGVVVGPEAFPEYLKSANAGTPHSLGSGIYAAIDPQGRVLVLDVVGGEVRIMKPRT